MPSPIYQYVINPDVSISIRRGPSIFMNVLVHELHYFNLYIKIFSKIRQLKNLNKLRIITVVKFHGVFLDNGAC